MEHVTKRKSTVVAQVFAPRAGIGSFLRQSTNYTILLKIVVVAVTVRDYPLPSSTSHFHRYVSPPPLTTTTRRGGGGEGGRGRFVTVHRQSVPGFTVMRSYLFLKRLLSPPVKRRRVSSFVLLGDSALASDDT